MVEIYYTPPKHDKHLLGKVAVISTRWNSQICDGLLKGYREVMKSFESVQSDFFLVSGAWEIPLMADRLASTGEYQVIVALGCVVRGRTKHFDLITDQCADGLMSVQLSRGVPIVFEVLAVDDFHQARQRSEGDLNAGKFAAHAVLEHLEQVKGVKMEPPLL